jgi:hypothetical protein
MIQYTASAVVAECYDCGLTKPCTRYTAMTPEHDTGYVVEYELCADCLDKRLTFL